MSDRVLRSANGRISVEPAYAVRRHGSPMPDVFMLEDARALLGIGGRRPI